MVVSPLCRFFVLGAVLGSRSRDAGGSGSQRPQQETTVGVAVSWNLNLDLHEVWPRVESHEVWPRVDGRGFGLANRFHG
jgi:hypothetical protein